MCGGVSVSNSRYPYHCITEKQAALAPLRTYSVDGTSTILYQCQSNRFWNLNNDVTAKLKESLKTNLTLNFDKPNLTVFTAGSETHIN
jgi:hypothetical protein